MESSEKKKAIELKDVCINYRILNATSVQKRFFHRKQREIIFEAVKHVSFAVEEGGILGIIGKNGSGKSTLLRSIAGVFSPNGGEINLKGHSVSLMALGVGFKDTLTGRENIMLSGMLLGFTQRQILEKMKSLILDRNRTVIIVSHSTDTLRELCDRILWIHDGEIREIGAPQEVLAHYVEFMNR